MSCDCLLRRTHGLSRQPPERTCQARRDGQPGDEAVTLAETVQGWRAGDRVIITDTQASPLKPAASRRTALAFIAEERKIRMIDGTQLVSDKPLARSTTERTQHVRSPTSAAMSSSSPPTRKKARPHDVSSPLGRIDQLCGNFATWAGGVLGRYPLHYHLVAGRQSRQQDSSCHEWPARRVGAVPRSRDADGWRLPRMVSTDQVIVQRIAPEHASLPRVAKFRIADPDPAEVAMIHRVAAAFLRVGDSIMTLRLRLAISTCWPSAPGAPAPAACRNQAGCRRSSGSCALPR